MRIGWKTALLPLSLATASCGDGGDGSNGGSATTSGTPTGTPLQAGSAFLPTEECVEPAIKTVFGGPNARHCDNLFLVETLVPHAPMPVDGFVLYAES